LRSLTSLEQCCQSKQTRLWILTICLWVIAKATRCCKCQETSSWQLSLPLQTKWCSPTNLLPNRCPHPRHWHTTPIQVSQFKHLQIKGLETNSTMLLRKALSKRLTSVVTSRTVNSTKALDKTKAKVDKTTSYAGNSTVLSQIISRTYNNIINQIIIQVQIRIIITRKASTRRSIHSTSRC